MQQILLQYYYQQPEQPSFFAFPRILIFIGIVFVIYAAFIASAKLMRNVLGHWHHLFETRPFTTSTFYDTLKAQIIEKGIDGVGASTVTYSEGGLASAKRLYLRVKFRKYLIDVCAAPFGKEGFFVSWWLGDAEFHISELLVSIPFIGRLFRRRQKTFYELDTEIMFKETIAKCVKETIESLTTEQGIRQPVNWQASGPDFKHS